MIFFAVTAIGVVLGSLLLLRPTLATPEAKGHAPVAEGAEGGDGPYSAVTFEDEADERDEADETPAFLEDDADWDDFLPRYATRRPFRAVETPDRPSPAIEEEEFDMAGLAARLAREAARPRGAPRERAAADATSPPPPVPHRPATPERSPSTPATAEIPQIDGFDAETDDLEIAGAADASVTTRAEAGGLTVLVDGEAVAFLGGLSTLDPARIRLTAA